MLKSINGFDSLPFYFYISYNIYFIRNNNPLKELFFVVRRKF